MRGLRSVGRGAVEDPWIPLVPMLVLHTDQKLSLYTVDHVRGKLVLPFAICPAASCMSRLALYVVEGIADAGRAWLGFAR